MRFVGMNNSSIRKIEIIRKEFIHLNVLKMIHPRGITGITASGGVTPSSSEKAKRSVNTMTEKTETFGIRLNRGDKKKIAGYITRKSIESILGQIERGEIEITDEGVTILAIDSVNTDSDSVNTTIERVSADSVSGNAVIDSVNTCEGCEYLENALDMSKFDEVCEFKGLDRQKALDKCVQMLWR